jgi:hypothetical protein
VTATGISPHLAITNDLIKAKQHPNAMKDTLLAGCADLPSADSVTVLLGKFCMNVDSELPPVTIDDLMAVLLKEAVAHWQMRTARRTTAFRPVPSCLRPSSTRTSTRSTLASKVRLWGEKTCMVTGAQGLAPPCHRQ